MIKSVICLIFLCNFYACKEAEKQSIENLPVAKNDTFEIVYDSHLQLPDGIYFTAL
jgi:hypothetical protein